jgi:hypothetical protein
MAKMGTTKVGKLELNATDFFHRKRIHSEMVVGKVVNKYDVVFGLYKTTQFE